MQYFTVTIPVKTYVRKYIEARYPQPMILSTNNYLGCVIYSYLEKTNNPLILRQTRSLVNSRYNKLTDSIKIEIPRYQIYKSYLGLNISPFAAILINNLFEEKIIEDLHAWCVAYEISESESVNRLYPYRQAVEAFCKNHNIDLEIDIAYDTIRKKEYRHKKSLHKSTTILSTPFFRV